MDDEEARVMTMVTPKTTRMGAYALVIMIVIVAEGKGDNRDVKKRAGMSEPLLSEPVSSHLQNF